MKFMLNLTILLVIVSLASVSCWKNLGEGECRSANGDYPLKFAQSMYQFRPHQAGDNAKKATEECLNKCQTFKDWCKAAEIVLRNIWPTPECRLVTDWKTFHDSGNQLQQNRWGGRQIINGQMYQNYCNTNGRDCESVSWDGGSFTQREGYHCYVVAEDSYSSSRELTDSDQVKLLINNEYNMILEVDSMVDWHGKLDGDSKKPYGILFKNLEKSKVIDRTGFVSQVLGSHQNSVALDFRQVDGCQFYSNIKSAQNSDTSIYFDVSARDSKDSQIQQLYGSTWHVEVKGPAKKDAEILQTIKTLQTLCKSRNTQLNQLKHQAIQKSNNYQHLSNTFKAYLQTSKQLVQSSNSNKLVLSIGTQAQALQKQIQTQVEQQVENLQKAINQLDSTARSFEGTSQSSESTGQSIVKLQSILAQMEFNSYQIRQQLKQNNQNLNTASQIYNKKNGQANSLSFKGKIQSEKQDILRQVKYLANSFSNLQKDLRAQQIEYESFKVRSNQIDQDIQNTLLQTYISESQQRRIDYLATEIKSMATTFQAVLVQYLSIDSQVAVQFKSDENLKQQNQESEQAAIKIRNQQTDTIYKEIQDMYSQLNLNTQYASKQKQINEQAYNSVNESYKQFLQSLKQLDSMCFTDTYTLNALRLDGQSNADISSILTQEAANV